VTGDPTSEPAPAGSDPTALATEGRAAYVISQLYYYVAAVVGVGFVIGGLIGFFFGVRTAVFPDEFETTREGLRGMLLGLSFAIPGLVTLWWHIRQARGREGRVPTGAFWGSALYFHLVALIALFFVIGGVAGFLAVLSEAVVPRCGFLGDLPPSNELVLSGSCSTDWGQTGRQLMNAAIFVLVGGPVMWWHLRQGRRLTTPPPAGGGG
jgi:hypothetical protein